MCASTLEPGEVLAESLIAGPALQAMYCGQVLQPTSGGGMISGEAIPNVRQAMMVPEGLKLAIVSIFPGQSAEYLRELCGEALHRHW